MAENRLAAAVVIAAAAGLFALTFGFERLPEGITRGFGAEAFPRLVLGTIMALAVLLLIGNAESEARVRIPPMVYYTAGSLLAFMALVPLAGMLPAMFLFQLGLGYLWGERRHLLLVCIAAVTTALIWAVFVRGFGIQLPQGVFS